MAAKSRNSVRKPGLSLERLEDRQMMAGDVAAFVSNGTLFIQEAAGHVGGAQAVFVSQGTTGKVTVQGITSPANTIGTLINGNQSVVEFNGVSSIDIKLGDGQDFVSLIGVPQSGQFKNLTINTSGSVLSQNDNDFVSVRDFAAIDKIDIRTGAGQDKVFVTNAIVRFGTLGAGSLFNVDAGVITAEGDADKDEVTLDGVTTSGFTGVNTGASDDSVTIRNSNFGSTAAHTMSLFTGAGADHVKIGSDATALGAVGMAGNLVLNTGHDSAADNDFVEVRDLDVDGSIFAELGGGDDRLDWVNVLSRKKISISAMKGNDTVNLTQVQAFDEIFTDMGEGSDTLNATFLKANRVELKGGDGDGYDRLFLSQSPNIPTLIRSGFEEINGNKLIKKVTPSPFPMANVR